MLKLEKINSLIIHCSDTDDDLDLRAQDIHKMHLGFGWDGIGYHKIICKNGDVENGRPEYWVGVKIEPKEFEFWQQGDFRLHKREAYSLKNKVWKRKILSP